MRFAPNNPMLGSILHNGEVSEQASRLVRHETDGAYCQSAIKQSDIALRSTNKILQSATVTTRWFLHRLVKAQFARSELPKCKDVGDLRPCRVHWPPLPGIPSPSLCCSEAL
jgi:hypothetical protein